MPTTTFPVGSWTFKAPADADYTFRAGGSNGPGLEGAIGAGGDGGGGRAFAKKTIRLDANDVAIIFVPTQFEDAATVTIDAIVVCKAPGASFNLGGQAADGIGDVVYSGGNGGAGIGGFQGGGGGGGGGAATEDGPGNDGGDAGPSGDPVGVGGYDGSGDPGGGDGGFYGGDSGPGYQGANGGGGGGAGPPEDGGEGGEGGEGFASVTFSWPAGGGCFNEENLLASMEAENGTGADCPDCFSKTGVATWTPGGGPSGEDGWFWSVGMVCGLTMTWTLYWAPNSQATAGQVGDWLIHSDWGGAVLGGGGWVTKPCAESPQCVEWTRFQSSVLLPCPGATIYVSFCPANVTFDGGPVTGGPDLGDSFTVTPPPITLSGGPVTGGPDLGDSFTVSPAPITFGGGPTAGGPDLGDSFAVGPGGVTFSGGPTTGGPDLGDSFTVDLPPITFSGGPTAGGPLVVGSLLVDSEDEDPITFAGGPVAGGPDLGDSFTVSPAPITFSGGPVAGGPFVFGSFVVVPPDHVITDCPCCPCPEPPCDWVEDAEESGLESYCLTITGLAGLEEWGFGSTATIPMFGPLSTWPWANELACEITWLGGCVSGPSGANTAIAEAAVTWHGASNTASLAITFRSNGLDQRPLIVSLVATLDEVDCPEISFGGASGIHQISYDEIISFAGAVLEQTTCSCSDGDPTPIPPPPIPPLPPVRTPCSAELLPSHFAAAMVGTGGAGAGCDTCWTATGSWQWIVGSAFDDRGAAGSIWDGYVWNVGVVCGRFLTWFVYCVHGTGVPASDGWYILGLWGGDVIGGTFLTSVGHDGFQFADLQESLALPCPGTTYLVTAAV